MDNSKNRPNDHLGVNKMGKNIRKSPLHQPNFNNNATRQQPQPQVYNISKNDFRNIVQQLTGSPSQEPLPRPPHNPPKPQSMRLQKIRPPPLTPINRPPLVPLPAPVPVAPPPVLYNNSFVRPPQFAQAPSPMPMQPLTPGDSIWSNTAESPITAYMRYLQNSFLDPSPRGNPAQPHLQQQPPPPGQPLAQAPGLLPNPSMPYGFPSPRMNGPQPPPPPAVPNFPSPQVGPALLPSPTSQFLLPSPTGYFNLLSPRSPYPLLSPGMQFPPLTPNFAFSPMGQTGILGPGPQPPPSPGLAFPLSPSGFFPISSPRWRDHR
ncbi:VQ motif containing protein [Trema orientale]|uniref:VQ motif containing protein n=1 Tax=Trema orientale TaxID=63057 RepID=A0A2P5EPC3_TREOI|nr:VQ motif containing protein [Trema orientale]